MRGFPVLIVIAFGLLVQFGCGGNADDEGGGNRRTGTTQAPGARRAAQGDSSAADNGEDAEIDIVGEYNYRSELNGGGFETGTVSIERLGESYSITMVPRRGNPYPGIAILTGNHLAICYSLAVERGVGSFVVNEEGNLTGHWATLGGEGQLLGDSWTKVE